MIDCIFLAVFHNTQNALFVSNILVMFQRDRKGAGG